MKVGVVGNPRYPDLKAVLELVALQAPYRGIDLYSEPRLGEFWPSRSFCAVTTSGTGLSRLYPRTSR